LALEARRWLIVALSIAPDWLTLAEPIPESSCRFHAASVWRFAHQLVRGNPDEVYRRGELLRQHFSPAVGAQHFGAPL